MTQPPLRYRIALYLARLIGGPHTRAHLATLTQPIRDEGQRWGALSQRPYERTQAEIQELYLDALTAWRKNPLAKRIVDITNDYVVGDGITLSSPYTWLQTFIDDFWYHPKNNMPIRIESMVEELTRAGNYLPILFTNPHDGMSYIRSATVDQIRSITTLPNDWETIINIQVTQYGDDGLNLELKDYPTAAAPDYKPTAEQIALFAINKPDATHLGEGDLTTVIPWMTRYSRLLEDRVRLNWAMRVYLWFVKVSSDKVAAKAEQYQEPPQPGTVIVHDGAEEWSIQSPNLHASDASHDLAATRRMVYSGTGYPPHWYAEQGSNLAEARASGAPAERHLRRRQLYVNYVLSQIVMAAYAKKQATRGGRKLPTHNYNKLFTYNTTDLSREDNATLAKAALDLSQAYENLLLETEPKSRSLTTELLTLFFKFAGEPKSTREIKAIVDDIFTNLEKGTPATSQ